MYRKRFCELYRLAAPSVVGIRAGANKGSGVLLDSSGYILSSSTCADAAGKDVWVYFHDRRRVVGRVVVRNAALEMILVKVSAEDVGAIPAMPLGDSDRTWVGQVACVVGDSFDSLFQDGQAAFSAGQVSALYELKGTTSYQGPVIETSAAVNPHSNGGPLVDAKGRLIAMVSLNYHGSRFAGVAIPCNRLLPELNRVQGIRYRRVVDLRAVGMELVEEEGQVIVGNVDQAGAAHRAGLREGDVLVRIGGERVRSARDVERGMQRSADVELLRRGDRKIVAWGKEEEY